MKKLGKKTAWVTGTAFAIVGIPLFLALQMEQTVVLQRIIECKPDLKFMINFHRGELRIEPSWGDEAAESGLRNELRDIKCSKCQNV